MNKLFWFLLKTVLVRPDVSPSGNSTIVFFVLGLIFTFIVFGISLVVFWFQPMKKKKLQAKQRDSQ